ncbi:MAG: hypothetical protein Q4A08_09655 [Bacteroidales bacterium]|nr:hypothetical protein [Bacteroidales bacterium]
MNLQWLQTGVGPQHKDNGVSLGYTNINGDNNNVGSGTQVIGTADPDEVNRLRQRVRELELENARLQGMVEVLKNK